MRYYLDTNILVFLAREGHDGISRDVDGLLSDYGNILMTSTVCVHEFIHLHQIGRIGLRKNDGLTRIGDFGEWLSQNGISIEPVSVKHLQQLVRLPIDRDHHDPNDRLIIAQAISDRVPLVSSDREFVKYGTAGLEFVYNRR